MDVTIQVPDRVDRVAAFGAAERNLKILREALGVNITHRGDALRVSGDRDQVSAANRVVERLIGAGKDGRGLSREQLLDVIAEAGWAAKNGAPAGPDSPELHLDFSRGLEVYARGRRVNPRTDNQKAYLEAIGTHDLVFGIGPAGTGKTYLAVAAAVHLLKQGRVSKAILARPAVEAGEKLGFLPGDQFAKVNPYLRPLLDALHDMIDYPTFKRFLESDVVEVVPLAYMRGRTLNDAVIILDEAQNTTRGQMQMFLTRLGQRGKMIVTGDLTQIDLPDARDSGLVDAVRRLRRTRGVATCTLGTEDIVRHNLVQKIIDAYAVREDDGSTRAAELLGIDGTGVTDGGEHHDAP